MGDRLHDHEPLGPPGGAVDQRGEHLGPLHGADRQRLVDDRHARGGERAPLDGAGQEDLGVHVVPGAQQVPGTQKLGARMVADRRLANEQPVDHQQPNRPRAAGEQPGGSPRTTRHVHHPGKQPLARIPRALRLESAREVGIGLQE
jgi:hypothetical protein